MENDLQELTTEVMDEVALKHMFMFQSYDICKLASQCKLSKFSIAMLLGT